MSGVQSAAKNGNLEVIKWLSERANQLFDPHVMDVAARNGHLEVIQWLHSNRKEGCKPQAMNFAAGNGHLALVKWLDENRTEGCTPAAMDHTCLNGHLEVVKFLHANRREGCTTKAMDTAIRNGHVDVAQWLKDNRTEGWSEDTPEVAMSRAASDGHLKILKWLKTNMDGTCTHKAMGQAASNGHLDVAKWLHENRSEGCTTEAMDQAAAYNGGRTLKTSRHEYSEIVREVIKKNVKIVILPRPKLAERERMLGRYLVDLAVRRVLLVLSAIRFAVLLPKHINFWLCGRAVRAVLYPHRRLSRRLILFRVFFAIFMTVVVTTFTVVRISMKVLLCAVRWPAAIQRLLMSSPGNKKTEKVRTIKKRELNWNIRQGALTR
ncbi:hypothetical protein PC116_g6023 [Phytophthora cactorum]|nr:hypothetical protein PC116_g6023 [Phytophthora cactorum]